LSQKSDAAFWEWYKTVDGNEPTPRDGWNAALAWSRPLVAEAIKKAKAGRQRTPKTKTVTRFNPPAVDELSNYMESQEFENPKETAEAFIAYYETRGWVPGGQRIQMKSWKAAVRTWKHNHFPIYRNGNGHERRLGCD
jgi:hypothetical protein